MIPECVRVRVSTFGASKGTGERNRRPAECRGHTPAPRRTAQSLTFTVRVDQAMVCLAISRRLVESTETQAYAWKDE